jgi:hypothetical protein
MPRIKVSPHVPGLDPSEPRASASVDNLPQCALSQMRRPCATNPTPDPSPTRKQT